MSVSASLRTNRTTAPSDAGSRRIYAALTGLSAVAVLLQGLWAGMFLEHDGQRDQASSWIDVHATGGEVAIFFAVVATVWALVRIRDRKDLVIGAAVFTVLLVLESYLGGLIRDEGKDSLTAVHIPLSLLLMGIAVWLPFRATRTAPER